MNCDMCGREAELFKAMVEGTQLTVCGNCAKYGKVLGRVRAEVQEKKKQASEPKREETIELLVSNFGAILKAKREQLGLSQKEFARKIAERESALHKMETGSIQPTIARARELEKLLGLKLVEEIRDEPAQAAKDKSVLTLGDFVKIKSRKDNK